MRNKIDILNDKINIIALSLNIALFDSKAKGLLPLGEHICYENLERLESGGIWLWDYQTNEVYYSEAFCESLGYNYGELGTGFSGFDLGNKEQMEAGMEMIKYLISIKSIGPFVNNITFTSKSKKQVPVECVGAVFYKNNDPYIVFGTHKLL